MTTVFCDQTSHTILKFVGVFPRGLNRIHDVIDELNGEDPFKGSARGVELLNSKFSHEHGSYVVEVRVPYEVHNGQYGGKTKVPQSSVNKLFDAIGEFQAPR